MPERQFFRLTARKLHGDIVIAKTAAEACRPYREQKSRDYNGIRATPLGSVSPVKAWRVRHPDGRTAVTLAKDAVEAKVNGQLGWRAFGVRITAQEIVNLKIIVTSIGCEVLSHGRRVALSLGLGEEDFGYQGAMEQMIAVAKGGRSTSSHKNTCLSR